MITGDAALLDDVREINDVYAAYLDDGKLEDWARLFTEDALYEIIARENYDAGLPHATVWCSGLGMINDRVMAVRSAMLYEDRSLRHFVSVVRINSRNGAEINAQANFMLLESMIDSKPEIILLGRYIDKFVRVRDQLRIKERHCVFDNYWLPRALILPV